ncbi:MAG: GGDEF domain-containing protein [Archangium sp.]
MPFERSPRVVFSLLTVVLLVGDAVTDVNLGFTAMYVLPVAGAAWFVGARFSIALALLTALVAEAIATVQTALPPHVIVWNAVMELAVLLLVSWLLVAVRTRTDTDPLTGVLSRSGFINAATREINRATRFGRPIVVAYLDVDHFKRVNDSLGHHAGDALLERIGQTLKTELRELDLVGRMGGDEFAFVLPEISDVTPVLSRLERALKTDTAQFGEFLSFSFGSIDAHGLTVDEALRRADAKMYAAKNR